MGWKSILYLSLLAPNLCGVSANENITDTQTIAYLERDVSEFVEKNDLNVDSTTGNSLHFIVDDCCFESKFMQNAWGACLL